LIFRMKRGIYGVAVVAMAGLAGVSVMAARHVDTIRQNTKVGNVAVGGLTPEEAAFKLRAWWETGKLKPIGIKSSKIKKSLPSLKPSELGFSLDDSASVAELPLQGALASLTSGQNDEQNFPLVFKANGQEPKLLAAQVIAAAGKPEPAHAYLVKGNIIQKPERSHLELDESGLPEAVANAINNGRDIELPLTEAAKKVPDDALKLIRDVVSTFSTRFNAGNRPRSNNIKLASMKINGTVIPPGEKFGFNQVVGQRTLKGGFQLAGVYVNGQHDVGVGGGICQVSTTLYNAALFADMQIVRRSNHSLPVPYVPLGRDATVNWGAQDLVFQNNSDAPIAISATYVPGRLTFRVLGQKKPGMNVKIERSGLSTRSSGVKTIVDPKLAPGKRRVVKGGSSGYSCTTYRLVYDAGKLVRKDVLGTSTYTGQTAIIAIGPAAKPPIPPPAVATPSLTPPTTTIPPST
jgi:vancomycin resistance protein YoaR